MKRYIRSGSIANGISKETIDRVKDALKSDSSVPKFSYSCSTSTEIDSRDNEHETYTVTLTVNDHKSKLKFSDSATRNFVYAAMKKALLSLADN